MKEVPMKMPPEILARLLRGEHFDIEQRRALELWPPETLRYMEVRAHLCELLKAEEWFPRLPTPSEAIYIHRLAPEEYSCVIWPGQGAKAAQKYFSSAQDAADFYLKRELHLPGSLDSWPVVDDR
ncbi:MAG: hypothetical protein WB716_11545 [Candidatus Acidiferrales bacterium]